MCMNNKNTIEVTTPLARASHQQHHHNCSNDYSSLANTMAALPKHNNMASLAANPLVDWRFNRQWLFQNELPRLDSTFDMYTLCDTSDINYCL